MNKYLYRQSTVVYLLIIVNLMKYHLIDTWQYNPQIRRFGSYLLV